MAQAQIYPISIKNITSPGRFEKNGTLVLTHSSMDKTIRVVIPNREDKEPIALLVYQGKYDEYLSAKITLSEDGKNYIVEIPVSEVFRAADPNVKQMIKIRGNRDYCLWVKVDYSELSEKSSLPTAQEYYRSLFTQALSNNFQINALMVVVPDKDPNPMNRVDPGKDQYYVGAHGAITVFSAKNSGWTLVNKQITPKDSLYSTHVFERRIYPDQFTGAMREEFERLPSGVKEKIKQEGILCRLTINYYPQTENGYQSMVQALSSGNFQIVTIQGHRYNSIRRKLNQWEIPTANIAPVAYFGNHCTSLASDNLPLNYVTGGKVFAPVGTVDSLNPGAEVNRDFIEMVLTGKVDPQEMRKAFAQTYHEEVDPKVNSNALFGVTPDSFANPYGDSDNDQLPNNIDPNPRHSNMYAYDRNEEKLLISTSNGLITLDFFPTSENEQILANALTPSQLEMMGIAGKIWNTIKMFFSAQNPQEE